jgi:hypothetical protein
MCLWKIKFTEYSASTDKHAFHFLFYLWTFCDIKYSSDLQHIYHMSIAAEHMVTAKETS